MPLTPMNRAPVLLTLGLLAVFLGLAGLLFILLGIFAALWCTYVAIIICPIAIVLGLGVFFVGREEDGAAKAGALCGGIASSLGVIGFMIAIALAVLVFAARGS